MTRAALVPGMPRIAGFLLVGLCAAGPLAGQAHKTAVAPDTIRHIQRVEPRSGPAGTLVSIYTENLPLQARVVIGVGAIGTGFEELAEAEQKELGEVSASVRVPETATWDRPLVFIIFNGNFSPTGLSDPFHVTNAEGHILRVGVLTDEGDGCVSMRDDEGYFYTLTGDVGEAKVGDPIAIEGEFLVESECEQGETIRIVKAGPPPPTDGRR